MLSAEVRRIISKDPALVGKVNGSFLPAAVKIVLSDAMRRSPVDTGRLKNSFGDRVERDRAIVYNTVHYAPHVEYGTVRMKAQPFMRPAIDGNKNGLVKLWVDIFRRVYGR